ncbi:MAG: RNA 3'-terminal phosphate cyclase [Pirellulaceae bacterium]|jgi:RNA 3'-terminal phosphate cyclase (ATP)|nr:RNA 3'-terminal phosphate cyclase [Pirellulaceae bacterium]
MTTRLTDAVDPEPVAIDGSFGEGGGQIIRSSIALSMITGRPVSIENVRAKRNKPGLKRQHTTAVRAAAEICGAVVTGDEIGSDALTFAPGPVKCGDFKFDIGTAGSTTLVFQTIAPALMLSAGESQVTLCGGTHNPFAPPWHFLTRVYLPLMNQIGPQVTTDLEQYGFYPGGGGRWRAFIRGRAQWRGMQLTERGRPATRLVHAIASNLPEHILDRETDVVRRRAGWRPSEVRRELVDAAGPGNVVMVEVGFTNVTELFVAIGERGKRAEQVAAEVWRAAKRYLDATAPVGEYLADQLLLPLAIAAAQGESSQFTATTNSLHAQTHVDVIQKFLAIEIDVSETVDGVQFRLS